MTVFSTNLVGGITIQMSGIVDEANRDIE